MSGHHFVCYSRVDGEAFAFKLYDALRRGTPSFTPWLDQKDLRPGSWSLQILEAISVCESLLFVMSADSVKSSECEAEWTKALAYQKPLIPLLVDSEIVIPYRLEVLQRIDFTGAFDPPLDKLRGDLNWLNTPEGEFAQLKWRFEAASRDLERTSDAIERSRIEKDIAQLTTQIEAFERIAGDPEGAVKRTKERITLGLELIRQPEQPVTGLDRTRFINRPPGAAPSYFQDRHVETLLIRDFLQDEARCLMTIVGRAGIGKTILACRLLKALEGGQLPDDLRPLPVDGIVYLSAKGSREITVPNLYDGLCELLPEDKAKELAELYENPKVSTADKMERLLAAFPEGRTIVLLDNFEDLFGKEGREISSPEIREALNAVLNAPPHGVKVILTSRIIPHDLALVHPERQMSLVLDEGLKSPYAENILRQMDVDGTLGLKDAPDAVLAEARERTLGLPHALEHLYAILSADRHTSIRELLRNTGELLPENVVEVLVGEAFSRLDPPAQMVMEALAVYGCPVAAVAVDYLLQPHQLAVDSAPVLNRLVNMQFVRKEVVRTEAGQEAPQYRLHPIDRAFALDRVPKGKPGDRRVKGPPRFTQYALWQRAADFFRQIRKPRSDWKSADDLAPQLSEFELRYAAEDYDSAGEILDEIDSLYLSVWGHYILVIEKRERLLGKLHHPKLVTNNLERLGYAHSGTGTPERAIELLTEALELHREHPRDELGEASALHLLALANGTLGNLQLAIDQDTHAREIARTHRKSALEADCLADLAVWNNYAGEPRKAIEHCEEALVIDRQRTNVVGEGVDLGSMGFAYWMLGDVLKAIEMHKAALRIAINVRDRIREATHRANLAVAVRELGHMDHAVAGLLEAIDVARQVGDRGGESLSLADLGAAYADLNDLGKAEQRISEALSLADQIPFPRGRLRALTNQGWRHLIAGEVHKADASYDEASQVARKIGDKWALAHALCGCARACHHAGNTAAARRHCQEALSFDFPTTNYGAAVRLGLVCLCEGDTRRAGYHLTHGIEFCRDQLQKAAAFCDALYHLALAQVANGETQGGLTTYDHALQVCPAKGVVRAALAELQLLRANAQPPRGIVEAVARVNAAAS